MVGGVAGDDIAAEIFLETGQGLWAVAEQAAARERKKRKTIQENSRERSATCGQVRKLTALD